MVSCRQNAWFGLPPYSISGLPLGLIGFPTLSGGNMPLVGEAASDGETGFEHVLLVQHR